MKARLIYWQKAHYHDRYILEMDIYDVGKSDEYPNGIKYGMLLFDLETAQRVLMDNHYPKGPHLHINEEEFAYPFVSVDQLVKDFFDLAFKHMGVKL